MRSVLRPCSGICGGLRLLDLPLLQPVHINVDTICATRQNHSSAQLPTGPSEGARTFV